MPDSYVRWLEFQHTPLPYYYNNLTDSLVRASDMPSQILFVNLNRHLKYKP